MGLSSALASAMSGLRANQAALSIVSSNVANAQTPGYVAQIANQSEMASGGFGTTVLTTGVTRELDLYVQGQVRTEQAGGGYANQISDILGQLQSVYGPPGGEGTLESSLKNFTTALQGLSTSGGSPSQQAVVLSSAQALAQQLNVTTRGIQSLRSNVQQDLGTAADKANTAMAQIADINTKLQGLAVTDPAAATLMDSRDSAIDSLSKLMDVRVVVDSSNQANLFTTTGIQLVGAGLPSQLIFNTPGALNATSLYSSNPAQSGVGQFSIKLPNGANLDITANKVITSGQIAADLKLRDDTLVQAQNQVDQLAATMASALSDKTTSGAPVSGPPSGFDLDVSNMLPGNSINLTVTDTATNTPRQISIINVNDPTALPLQNAVNANPQRIGIDFSGGVGSIVSQLGAALGPSHLNVGQVGSMLRVTADTTGAVSLSAASVTKTINSLASGNPQLPLFVDGASPYTGKVTAGGVQMTGLAGRIAVNAAVMSDASKLSVYSTSPVTPAGDTTRPDFIYSQLTKANFTFSPQTGLGSNSQPFTGTVSNFLQQFLSLQSNAATQADRLQQGQSVVVSTLQQKFNSTSSVNLDSEMSNLIQLQNAYAANAHIMSVVQSMMNTLMQAQV